MAEMGEKRLNGFKKRLTKPDTDDEIEVSEENIYALLGLPRRRF
jgi:hypothetical protein